MKSLHINKSSAGFGLAFAFLIAASTARAHVDWSRLNAADPEIVGLYHFDGTEHLAGETLKSDTCVPVGTGLLIGSSAGAGMTTVTGDYPEPYFGPRAIRFQSAQRAESTAEAVCAGDVSIEFWMKWPITLSTSTFEIGFTTGPKLRFSRTAFNPASHRFGLMGAAGDFRTAPGFTDWDELAAVDEALPGEWSHYGVTIHSTGASFDSGSGHYLYNAGSVARVYLNGHPTGLFPHTLDIAGMRTAASSKVTINNVAGEVFLDEVTVWSRDWSSNGAVTLPFPDGRGSGECAPAWTRLNRDDPDAGGVYHLDGLEDAAGETIPTVPCLPVNRGLLVGAPAGTAMTNITDLPSPLFGPRSIRIGSAQSIESTGILTTAGGDLTIEAWVKWDPALSSNSVGIGFRNGPKIRLIRNTATPASDSFGMVTLNGDFRAAPGFTGWTALGLAAAPLGDWFHVAMTVHSTGLSFDTPSGHYLYNPGSAARFWINGRLVGLSSAAAALNIAGQQGLDVSTIRINNGSGAVQIDEFAVWSRDWSQDGAIGDAFTDGRGSGLCNGAGHWELYD